MEIKQPIIQSWKSETACKKVKMVWFSLLKMERK